MGFIQDFCELENELLEQITVKMESPHRINAFKITSQSDFDLMIEYLSAAHSICNDPTPIKINGNYHGADWYFLEEHDFGHNIKLRLDLGDLNFCVKLTVTDLLLLVLLGLVLKNVDLLTLALLDYLGVNGSSVD